MIVATTDFIGIYHIAQTCYNDAQAYIDKYEPLMLKKLLGCELYDLYIAAPTDARFLAISGNICITDTGCDNKIYISEGFKKMLLGFIYYEYVNHQSTKNATVGAVKKIGENSVPSSNQSNGTIDRYNYAIGSYQAIQKFIKDNTVDYPEYKGVELRSIIFGGMF